MTKIRDNLTQKDKNSCTKSSDMNKDYLVQFDGTVTFSISNKTTKIPRLQSRVIRTISRENSIAILTNINISKWMEDPYRSDDRSYLILHILKCLITNSTIDLLADGRLCYITEKIYNLGDNLVIISNSLTPKYSFVNFYLLALSEVCKEKIGDEIRKNIFKYQESFFKIKTSSLLYKLAECINSYVRVKPEGYTKANYKDLNDLIIRILRYKLLEKSWKYNILIACHVMYHDNILDSYLLNMTVATEFQRAILFKRYTIGRKERFSPDLEVIIFKNEYLRQPYIKLLKRIKDEKI